MPANFIPKGHNLRRTLAQRSPITGLRRVDWQPLDSGTRYQCAIKTAGCTNWANTMCPLLSCKRCCTGCRVHKHVNNSPFSAEPKESFVHTSHEPTQGSADDSAPWSASRGASTEVWFWITVSGVPWHLIIPPAASSVGDISPISAYFDGNPTAFLSRYDRNQRRWRPATLDQKLEEGGVLLYRSSEAIAWRKDGTEDDVEYQRFDTIVSFPRAMHMAIRTGSIEDRASILDMAKGKRPQYRQRGVNSTIREDAAQTWGEWDDEVIDLT